MLPSIHSLLCLIDNRDESFYMESPPPEQDVTQQQGAQFGIQNSQSSKRNYTKKRTPFTEVEDQLLKKLVNTHGTNWNLVSHHMIDRSPRQCRDRWMNYLSPEITNAPWTVQEDQLLFQKYQEFGPQWKAMTPYFKNRSYNAIRNRFVAMQRMYQM